MPNLNICITTAELTTRKQVDAKGHALLRDPLRKCLCSLTVYVRTGDFYEVYEKLKHDSILFKTILNSHSNTTAHLFKATFLGLDSVHYQAKKHSH
jgi:hypothetical protein